MWEGHVGGPEQWLRAHAVPSQQRAPPPVRPIVFHKPPIQPYLGLDFPCAARLEELVPAEALAALAGDMAELRRAADDDHFAEELRASDLVRRHPSARRPCNPAALRLRWHFAGSASSAPPRSAYAEHLAHVHRGGGRRARHLGSVRA